MRLLCIYLDGSFNIGASASLKDKRNKPLIDLKG